MEKYLIGHAIVYEKHVSDFGPIMACFGFLSHKKVPNVVFFVTVN